jgi:amino acid adenylation domain-containing protein
VWVAPLDETDSVAALFDLQAERTPDRPAVLQAGDAVTYSDLQGRVNQLECQLRCLGARPEEPIAILADHPLEMIVGSLAALKAGGACLPLDIAWPEQRLRRIVEDARSDIVVISASLRSKVRFDARTLVLGSEGMSSHVAATRRPTVPTPEQLFAVVYSSGSTGQPKGVSISHRSVLNRLRWMWSVHPFVPGDVSLLYRSHAIIGFTWDCFGPLLAGVPIAAARAADVRDPAALVETAVRYGVSHVSASPGRWTAILDHLDRHSVEWRTLRLGRTSGEPLPPDLVVRWRQRFPHVPLINIYGATECSSSTACDTTTVAMLSGARVTVGTPVANVSVHVLNEALDPVAAGEEGEVCVAGSCLARGYLRQPSLTAERFVPNPHGSLGERLFRTGDLGVQQPDGTLEIVGRRDCQVKIRGYRVDVGEVEAALSHCPSVKIAAVVPYEPVAGDVRLGACVLLDRRDAGTTADELRARLAEMLPEYMVPAAILLRDEMPRTPSGKIGRPELKRWLEAAADAPRAWEPPRTPEEKIVADIWCRVLGRESVGIDDNFFDLGGHSLLAMKILSAIHDALGADLSLERLFEAPTIRALAPAIDSARAAASL